MAGISVAERLAFSEKCLDMLVSSLREDLRRGPMSGDELAAMVEEMKMDLSQEWLETVLWILAVAQFRLAQQPPA